MSKYFSPYNGHIHNPQNAHEREQNARDVANYREAENLGSIYPAKDTDSVAEIRVALEKIGLYQILEDEFL